MKKQILRAAGFGLFSVLALVATAGAARAQSPARLALDVPFDFYVGDQLMPAGRYTVRRAVKDTDRTLVVAGENEGARAAGVTAPAEGRESRRGALVFHRYGGEYFLRSAWAAGEAEGREFRESKRERAARRGGRLIVKNGGGGVRPEVVEVTAGR